jgi:hypothetical protein
LLGAAGDTHLGLVAWPQPRAWPAHPKGGTVMRGETRRKIEGGARVGEFSVANPSTEPSHEAVVTKLRETLAQADGLGIQQRDGLSNAQAATSRRNQIRLRIEFGLLGPLVKVSRSAEKDAPELLGKFRFKHNAAHKAFLIQGRSMLAAATAAKDVLLAHGLPTTLLDDLAKALNTFEAEGDLINLSRRAHIGARADLKVVVAKLSELVDVLDGFNRYRYQNDPDQLAVWNAAKTVVSHSARKSGTVMPPASPAAPDGSTKVA